MKWGHKGRWGMGSHSVVSPLQYQPSSLGFYSFSLAGAKTDQYLIFLLYWMIKE